MNFSKRGTAHDTCRSRILRKTFVVRKVSTVNCCVKYQRANTAHRVVEYL